MTVSNITTYSLKLDWTFDNSTSIHTNWMVKYTDRGQGETSEIETNSTNETDTVIDNLYSGATYTVNVFGVTLNDVLGDRSTEVEATISK